MGTVKIIRMKNVLKGEKIGVTAEVTTPRKVPLK
jgi:hypothetical protein